MAAQYSQMVYFLGMFIILLGTVMSYNMAYLLAAIVHAKLIEKN